MKIAYRQKWVHTHTIRIILVHDQRLPSNLFVPDMSTGVLAKVTAKDALTALHEALSQITTFPLVRGQSYVKLVVGEDPSRPPVFFYMIRTSMEAPCIALKIAFLGGISGVIRNKIVNDIKDAIMSLEVERCVYLTAMCEFSDSRDDSTIFTRASKIPVAVDRIVRLERAGSTNREMILHNSIAKYLCCRRQIWRMQKAFASAFSLTNASAEFILNTLLQRRLSEGFHISYGANGVVNLVRQVRPETDEYLGFAVEQYIIFPPSRINDGRGFDLPKASSVEPRFSSHILHENSEEFTSESYTQKSDADLQLITELWTEPLATTDEEAIQRTAQRYRQVSFFFHFISFHFFC
ncbi:unnamed protein product [Toxocara canis]|uniref:Uncharacterized protein n=1 Tax=Toxocara canis TaxID=6265 RepID=A0A183UNU4_TOXCA|nr:unnamed protein product [Toxocara canis]